MYMMFYEELISEKSCAHTFCNVFTGLFKFFVRNQHLLPAHNYKNYFCSIEIISRLFFRHFSKE